MVIYMYLTSSSLIRTAKSKKQDIILHLVRVSLCSSEMSPRCQINVKLMKPCKQASEFVAIQLRNGYSDLMILSANSNDNEALCTHKKKGTIR